MVSDTGASAAFRALVEAPPARLRATMQRGAAPTPAALAGREFRGANTQKFAAWLGIRRFVKGFKADEGGAVSGYNVRVAGTDLGAPWTTTTWRGSREFAFFKVTAVEPESEDNQYLNALLLDYGAVGSGPDPSRAIRDYVVTVEGGAELLLGHAFAAVGTARLPLGFFVLEPL